MSSAIDRAVNEINLQPLAGKEVFLDTDRLTGFADQHYLIGTLRQAMLSSGVQLKPDRALAKYIVEARAGVLGTNSSSVMIGVPATNLPNLGTPGVPSAIPEIPFAKTTRQAGIAKIALFAYNQQSGKPVWQSGTFPVMADAKNTWFFGAVRYQRGSIYGDARGTNERGLLSFRGESIAASASRPYPSRPKPSSTSRPNRSPASRTSKTKSPRPMRRSRSLRRRLPRFRSHRRLRLLRLPLRLHRRRHPVWYSISRRPSRRPGCLMRLATAKDSSARSRSSADSRQPSHSAAC